MWITMFKATLKKQNIYDDEFPIIQELVNIQ